VRIIRKVNKGKDVTFQFLHLMVSEYEILLFRRSFLHIASSSFYNITSNSNKAGVAKKTKIPAKNLKSSIICISVSVVSQNEAAS
jgi:hypothetical protein